jgi:uncharacterized protein YegP (UPF0339 family)
LKASEAIEVTEYFTDRAGKWRYRVKGKNGEKLVTSEPYASKSNAVRGYGDLRAAVLEDGA